MHPTRYNPRLVRTGVRSELPVERVLDEEFPFPGLPVRTQAPSSASGISM